MKHFLSSILLLLVAASGFAAAPDFADVLVYPVRDEGSIMHWLQIAPLPWNAAYIGDSQSYDPFKPFEMSELALRPRAGDKVGKSTWRKMHYNGSTEGATMCNLTAYGGHFTYAYTVAVAYLYSPVERPDAWFNGSADDGLKVVLNGKKLWSNQIQRSPSYDSDRFAAPLKKGWNTLVMLVDQISGGHLLCARFVDGDKPLTDLEISLDPPAEGAKRHLAAAYNSAATAALVPADKLRADGKLAEAAAAYAKALEKYPLADEAPRAAYAAAQTVAELPGQADKAVALLQNLVETQTHDVLAEYAQLDLARIQKDKLGNMAAAAEAYAKFETIFPDSARGATALVALARIHAEEKRVEEAILACRLVISKYPETDDVMTATLAIADFQSAAGEKDKAKAQYEAARAMAQDWHDNKYGIDVGKQAWLRGLLDDIRVKLDKLG